MEDTNDDIGSEDDELVHVEECPSCGTEEVHDILSEKEVGGGADYRVRCETCSHVHLIQVRPPKAVIVQFTLSDGAHSISEEIEVDEDEIIHVGDVFDHAHRLWKVQTLHLKQEQDVRYADPSSIVSAWAVRCDLVRIKVTMTRGEESTSSIIESDPETVFSCGTIIEHDGGKWRIRAIHTGLGRTLTGRREAAEIRRLFLHPPPEPGKRRWQRD
ncbi:MAG: HVO_0476 family zinc finger protein [Candidatus Thalassarchaeaceae archaeon]